MSRSHKKHPHINATPRHAAAKRAHNRRLRRQTGLDDISDGNHYRKMNESWDICDQSFYGLTWNEFKIRELREDPDADVRELRRLWLRWYGGK